MSIINTRAEAPASAVPIADAVSHRPLQRIREIRQQQGLSLRTCARRMQATVQQIRHQEEDDADMMLSDLYRWQRALEVPVVDLLVDLDAPLSAPVLQRARLLKMMKTALAIRESSEDDSVRRLAQTLADQLVEIMPELKDVSPWHTVGQRRTLEELGRIAEHVIPERILMESVG
jgi:transcriptional regulator with XRE-family HTH domain